MGAAVSSPQALPSLGLDGTYSPWEKGMFVVFAMGSQPRAGCPGEPPSWTGESHWPEHECLGEELTITPGTLVEAGITGCFPAGGGGAAGLSIELKGFGIPKERRESRGLGTPRAPFPGTEASALMGAAWSWSWQGGQNLSTPGINPRHCPPPCPSTPECVTCLRAARDG